MKKLALLLTLTLTLSALTHARDFDSLAALEACKGPNPQYLNAWKQIVAQGGPSWSQTRDAIVTYIKSHLKDPDSAKAINADLPFFNTRATIHKDWIIRFACNGKNSFGAYVGSRVSIICWKDGQIDAQGQMDFENWGGSNN